MADAHVCRYAYVASTSGVLLRVALDTCTVEQTWSAPSPIFASPAVLPSGHVVVAHMRGVACLSPSLQTVTWQWPATAPVYSSPVAVPGCAVRPPLVVFGGHDCAVQVRLDDGTSVLARMAGVRHPGPGDTVHLRVTGLVRAYHPTGTP